MKSQQTFFFADRHDIEPIITLIESIFDIKYCGTGMFLTIDHKYYGSLLDFEGFGSVNNGDWNQSKSFLVLPSEGELIVRNVPQKAGGIRYAIDQQNNPKSIVIKPSGIFKEGVLVAGMLGTISHDDFSLKLFKEFSSKIKKTFTKLGQFYVGPNAKVKLENGWRLVTNEQSPKEYDITN